MVHVEIPTMAMDRSGNSRQLPCSPCTGAGLGSCLREGLGGIVYFWGAFAIRILHLGSLKCESHPT